MPIKGTAIWVEEPHLAQLQERGFRSWRGGGNFNLRAGVHRSLALYFAVLEHSDPRETGNFPEPFYALALDLLTEPWFLTVFEIEHLAIFLQRLRGFSAALGALSVDRESFLKALSALSFAEKAFLVDAALQHHGPPAAEAESLG